MRTTRTLVLLAFIASGCGAKEAPPATAASATSCPPGSTWNGALCVRTERDPTPAPSASAPPPSQPTSADREAARRHFSAGVSFFNAADYVHALEEFEAAYALVPTPAVLYDIEATRRHLAAPAHP